MGNQGNKLRFQPINLSLRGDIVEDLDYSEKIPIVIEYGTDRNLQDTALRFCQFHLLNPDVFLFPQRWTVCLVDITPLAGFKLL